MLVFVDSMEETGLLSAYSVDADLMGKLASAKPKAKSHSKANARTCAV